jgi:hypothetical protein
MEADQARFASEAGVRTAKLEKIEVQSFALRPEAVSVVEKNWDRLTQRRPDLFNGTMLRVVSVDTRDDIDVVSVAADIDYKTVVGLRYNEGSEPAQIDPRDSFRSLTSYLFIYTADQKHIFIERDCGDWDKALDMPGGFIQARYEMTDGKEFAVRRTKSDLNISDEDIANVTYLGTYDYAQILEYMLIYRVDLALTLEELKRVAQQTIYEVPEGYSTILHDTLFDMRLHIPARTVLNVYLDVARKGYTEHAALIG